MLQAEQMTTLERKIGTFSEILAKKPDDDLTILALAEACFRRGVKLEALKAYQEVISRSPVPEAHLAVAEIYADQSMFAEAYGELRQLFVLDPNSVEARLLILELQGKSTPPDDLAEIMRKPTSEDAFEEAKVRLKIQKTIHTRELQERTRNVTLEPGIVIHEYYVEEAKKKLIGVDDQLKELQRLRESNRVLSQPPRPQVMAPERPADSGFTPTGMIPDVAVTPDLPDMAPPEMPESGEIPSPVGSGEVPSPMGSGEIPSPVDSGEFSSPVDSGESPAVEPAAAVPEFAGLSPIGDLPPPPEVPEPVGPVSTEPSAVIPDSPDPLAMAPELPSPPEPPMPMVPEAISPVAPSEPVAAIPEPPAPMAPPEPPAPVAPEPVAITPELPAPPEPPAPMVPEPPAPVAPLEPVAKLPEPPAPVDFPEPPSPVAPPEPMMPEPNASVAEPPAPVAPPEPAMPGPPTPLMPEPIAVMPDPPAPITPEPPAPPAPVEPSPPEPLAVLPEPPAMPEPPTFEPMMPEPPAPIAPPEPTATIQPLESPAPVAPEPPAPVAPPAPTAPVEPPAPTASMAPPEPPAPVAPPEPPAPVAPPEPPAPVAPPEPPAPVAPPEPPAPVAPPEPPAPVAPPRAASGGVSEARKAYYTSQAEALSSLTATLARTRGVTSIFLVAREGVTIDSVAKDAISEARIGELVHESFEFLEAFAKDPSYWVLECAGGIFVMQKLDARHVLIAIGQAGANFGALRYTMDKTKTKFEQILSLTPA